MRSLLIPFLLASSTVYARPSQMLDVKASKGATVQVTINDVLTHEKTDGSNSGEIIYWLKPGKNTLKCVVTKGDKDGGKCERRWLGAGGKEEEAKVPLGKAVEISDPAVVATDMWTKTAAKLPAGAKAKKDAMSLVENLHAAFSKQDVDAIAGALSWRQVDIGKAMGMPMTGEQLKKMYEEMKASGAWTVAPLDAGKVRVDATGAGRFLRVSRAGGDLITVKTKEGTMSLDVLYLGQIDGKLVVVR